MMKEKYIAYTRFWLKRLAPAIVMAIVAIICTLSLWSFRFNDISLLYYARFGVCQNILGYFGATVAAVLVYLFGSMAYAVPTLLLYGAFFGAKLASPVEQLDRIIGIVSGFFIMCALFTYHMIGHNYFSACGGIVGTYIINLLHGFDPIAAGVVLYSLLFVASILALRFAHLKLIQQVIRFLSFVGNYCVQVDNVPARVVRFVAMCLAKIFVLVGVLIVKIYRLLSGAKITQSLSSIVQIEREDENVDHEIAMMLQSLQPSQGEQDAEYDQDGLSSVGLSSTELSSVELSSVELEMYEENVEGQTLFGMSEQQSEPEIARSFSQTADSDVSGSVVKKRSYILPDIEKMLAQNTFKQPDVEQQNQALAEQAAILEEKLRLFGVKGEVTRVHPGPVITLFEYKPDVRIKLSKILGLEDDLAMALQALSIRIIAPIPGKDVVGFEVSNKIRKAVLLSDIFHSAAWTKFKGSLPLILGEDSTGSHVVVDLATMPHVLIAGSTGSGKSVGLNCMLVSLLCAKKPSELKMIIVDPKQIEFTAYENIPHLLFPVVTDPRRALPIFKWLVSEMEQRYEQMAEVGVRNIFEYQALCEQRTDLEAMPFIVMVIDELADLMMTTGKDIEGLIARLAQMSRAAGIHMIVATQRPSVDVITGLIKVNFPNRISFKVTSKVDSRTILDEIGAERLLGKGDMLFIDAKEPHIRRVHGAYVSNKELEYLVKHVEGQQAPQFLDIGEFLKTEDHDEGTLLDSDHELFEQVIAMLKDVDEVSISMIQRRFRIGFNRSARIIETLESRGLLMSSDGGKMRRVVKN